ncbi:uncharacterized protein LOC125544791 isoform X4 [Triticum urartu]|uniref:uncharacterized protein LOC125544791 isoform X4 n=1 Tax=Triticum urartu TaxID=4572 RepID=UPI002043B272|nr:uncharacterized protein LOC125544791 isoform X4 [Triticum urartu]
MEGNFSADQRAKVVAVLYMVPGDLNGQFHAEKMGYHEMVLLRPQGAAEVVVLAAEFDNTHISSPASAHWGSSSLQMIVHDRTRLLLANCCVVSLGGK